jgi:hypothetical protein
VMRALAKQPEERPSVTELARSFRDAVSDEGGPIDHPLGVTVELPR